MRCSMRRHRFRRGRSTMRSLWPNGGLWRHGDFLKLWAGETISHVRLAGRRPRARRFVAILVLDASAFEVAVLGTLNFLPFIIFTLPAGVWVDRLRGGRSSSAATSARAALLATIPIAYVADALTLVAALRRRLPRRPLPGVLRRRVPCRTSRRSSIATRSSTATRSSRSAARRRRSAGPGSRRRARPDLHRAVRRSRRRTQLRRLGPVPSRHPQARGAAAPRSSRVTARKPSMWTELKEGLRFVFDNPNLRAQAGCTATSNFFSSLAFAIILVFAVRELGLSARRHRPRLLGRRGWLARRGLHGDAHLRPLRDRPDVDRRRGARSGRRSSSSPSRPEGNAAIPFLVAAQLVFGFTVVVYNIAQVSYRQAICPPRLQGRMNSVDALHRLGHDPARNAPGRCARAPGSGCARRSSSARSAAESAVLWLLFSPQRHLREMPEPIDDDAVAEAGLAA